MHYAKKMAQGYLRSVGSGEYTPKYSGYAKEIKDGSGKPSHTHWKKADHEHDEFDF